VDPVLGTPNGAASSPNIGQLAAALALARQISTAQMLAQDVLNGYISDCQALSAFADATAGTGVNPAYFVQAFQVLTPGPEVSKLVNLFGTLSGVEGLNAPIQLQPTETVTNNGFSMIIGLQPLGFAGAYQDTRNPSSDQGSTLRHFSNLALILALWVSMLRASSEVCQRI